MKWRLKYALCRIIKEPETMSRIKRELKQEKFVLRLVNKGCDSNFRYAVTYHQAKWGKKKSAFKHLASEWYKLQSDVIWVVAKPRQWD